MWRHAGGDREELIDLSYVRVAHIDLTDMCSELGRNEVLDGRAPKKESA